MKIKKIQYFLITKSVGLYINLLGFIAPKKAALVAYRIFSKPRKGKLNKDFLPIFFQNAKLETLLFEHHKIQTYSWSGNKNVILLVHGWESNTTRWKKLFAYLETSKSTLVALDAPAHGLTSGEEFNAILYSKFIKVVVEHYKPSIIIGHSVGAMASLYYQSQSQNPWIKKMVLLGAPSDLEQILQNYVSLIGLNSKMRKQLALFFTQKFKLQIADFSGIHFGKKLEIEGIIAHDYKDKIVLFSESEKIASSWTKAKYIKTNGFGHSLHQPELYQEILEFVSE